MSIYILLIICGKQAHEIYKSQNTLWGGIWGIFGYFLYLELRSARTQGARPAKMFKNYLYDIKSCLHKI